MRYIIAENISRNNGVFEAGNQDEALAISIIYTICLDEGRNTRKLTVGVAALLKPD